MGIRNIREIGEPVLRTVCKEVTEITPRIEELAEDLFDTMYDAQGVGLAAPQVGIRKRICVIDTGLDEEPDPLLLINPVILATDGEQEGREGCLSIPGKFGIVSRPNYVRVRAQDLNFEYFEVEAEELKARAILHEMDHLDGTLFVDRAEGRVYDLGTKLGDEDEEEDYEEE